MSSDGSSGRTVAESIIWNRTPDCLPLNAHRINLPLTSRGDASLHTGDSMAKISSKQLICRFHGGDKDGTFDSRIDQSYGIDTRDSMFRFYSQLRVGEMRGGLNQSAQGELLTGIPIEQVKGRDQFYVVMNRKDSDHSIELDLASAAIKTIAGEQFVVGKFNGEEFVYKIGTE